MGDLDRIAKAICEADGFNWDDQRDPMRSSNGDQDGQAHYVAHAVAALQALTEPSEEMVLRGAGEIGPQAPIVAASDIFTAMIKSILDKEQEHD